MFFKKWIFMNFDFFFQFLQIKLGKKNQLGINWVGSQFILELIYIKKNKKKSWSNPLIETHTFTQPVRLVQQTNHKWK